MDIKSRKMITSISQVISSTVSKLILDKVSSTNYVMEIYIEKKNHDKKMIPTMMINAYMMAVSEKFNKKIGSRLNQCSPWQKIDMSLRVFH